MNADALMTELLNLPWFSHCGAPLKLHPLPQVPRALAVVRTGTDATELIRRVETENQNLDIANEYRADARKRGSMHLTEWNARANRVRPWVYDQLLPIVRGHLSTAGLEPAGIDHHVSWQVIHLFHELVAGGPDALRINTGMYLPLYRAGRLPCAWDGGWKRGTLQVY